MRVSRGVYMTLVRILQCVHGDLTEGELMDAIEDYRRDFPREFRRTIQRLKDHEFKSVHPNRLCDYTDEILHLMFATRPIRIYPRTNRLHENLDLTNLVTLEPIPLHRARYIPENNLDGQIRRVYNKETLRRTHDTMGVSPFTRRPFDGGRKIPKRLRGEYKRRLHQQIMDANFR